MRNLKIGIEYDGYDFSGWQIQKNCRTVQGELTKALSVLFGGAISPPIASGRTDAGTHAFNQIAHLNTDTTLPTDRIKRGLNGILPRDISILSVNEYLKIFMLDTMQRKSATVIVLAMENCHAQKSCLVHTPLS